MSRKDMWADASRVLFAYTLQYREYQRPARALTIDDSNHKWEDFMNPENIDNPRVSSLNCATTISSHESV